MIVELKYTLERLYEHGLHDNYPIICDYKNMYSIYTETVNDEHWYSIYKKYENDYCFSSRDLGDCLEYLEIPFY